MCDLNSNYAFMPHKRDANKPTIGTFGGRVLSLPRRELQCFPGRFRLDCKTVSFFLKISKEIGKAWRKNLKLARCARASHALPGASLPSLALCFQPRLTAGAYLNTQKYGLFCSLVQADIR